MSNSEHWYDREGNLVDKWTKGAYPSVNTILDVYNDPTNEQFAYRMGERALERLQELAERGTRVQKAIEMFHKGSGNYRAYLEDGDEPFLEGYMNWLDKYGFTILETEVFVRSDKYKFAGRIDAIGADPSGRLWILDNKTGIPKVRHGLQLKGYWQAYLETYGKRLPMGGIYLTDSLKAGYRFSRTQGMVQHKEPWSAFEAHLNVFRYWQRKSKSKAPQDINDVVVADSFANKPFIGGPVA